MNARPRPTIDQNPDMSATLIRGCDDRVEIIGVDDEFIDPGMLIDGQDRIPRRAAIRRFIKATIAAL